MSIHNEHPQAYHQRKADQAWEMAALARQEFALHILFMVVAAGWKGATIDELANGRGMDGDRIVPMVVAVLVAMSALVCEDIDNDGRLVFFLADA